MGTYRGKDAYKARCQDCPALVAGPGGAWVCDELERDIHKVATCPEGLALEKSVKKAKSTNGPKAICKAIVDDFNKNLIDLGTALNRIMGHGGTHILGFPVNAGNDARGWPIGPEQWHLQSGLMECDRIDIEFIMAGTKVLIEYDFWREHMTLK